MHTWWLWRLKPKPKKRLATDLQLPVSYLASDRFDPESIPGERIVGSSMHPRALDRFPQLEAIMAALETELKRLKIPTNGHVRQESIGAMRTFKIEIHAGSPIGKQKTPKKFWLTPPIEQFADTAKHFTAAQIEAAYGYGNVSREPTTFFVNREVLEAEGEFLKGSFDDDNYRVIELMNTRWIAEQEGSPIANFLLVALDSYLEKSGRDPRFNPPPTRKALPESRVRALPPLRRQQRR